jgi:hypothetical protein
MTTPIYNLPLTADEAHRLLRMVSVADLAIAEHLSNGWLPKLSDDARLMSTYLKQLESGPTLERPLTALRKWLRGQERNEEELGGEGSP